MRLLLRAVLGVMRISIVQFSLSMSLSGTSPGFGWYRTGLQPQFVLIFRLLSKLVRILLALAAVQVVGGKRYKLHALFRQLGRG